MGNAPTFSLPPWPALSFMPFLLLEAVLLQPSVAASIHPTTLRCSRILLTCITAFLAIVAPLWWRIEPVELSLGANFRLGIFGPNFLMKAIEFGFVTDPKRYVWVGLGDEAGQVSVDVGKQPEAVASGVKRRSIDSRPRKDETSMKKQAATLPTPPESPVLQATAEPSVGSDGQASKLARDKANEASDEPRKVPWSTVLADAVHLCTAMRGIGYAFGPKRSALPPIYHANDRRRFLRRAALRFLRSHVISTACIVLITHRNDLVTDFIHQTLAPVASQSTSQLIANIMAYLSVGVSLHAQMLVGFEGCKMAYCVASMLPLPFGWRVAFDPREWPDLFWHPFLPQTVGTFWSNHWHHLFRAPFTSVGFEPVNKAVSTVLGKTAGRALGVITVFSLSSWLHDQALWSARWRLPEAELVKTLSFTERWGGWMFFLLQAFAIIVEASVAASLKPKRKLRGLHWRLWSYFWIVGVGCLAGRSWLALGLANGVPPIDNWAWQRWLVPTFSLAPPPIFLKH